MFLFEVGFVELQGMATVILFALVFYLMTELRRLRSELKVVQPAAHSNNPALQLQAYERLTLLADRLSIKNLVSRLHSNTYTATELQGIMIETIKSEYEHNVTQQVYVNPEVWKAVTNLKEQNIYIINQLATGIPPQSPAVELSKQLLEYASRENAELSGLVLNAIQFEAKKLI